MSAGDKILLKAPQNSGVVIEYVSYVAEVNWQTVDTEHIPGIYIKVIHCLNLQIHDEKVSLRVNAELLRSYTGEPLDVEFCYNRLEQKNK